jgi:hypothetical protein
VGSLDRELLPSPSVEAVAALVPHAELAKIIARDGALLQSLQCWAMGHTQHPQNAEDLCAETVARALDPRYQGWDRDQYPTAGAFLGSVMNGIARNRRRSSYDANRAPLDEESSRQVPAPRADPEGQLAMVALDRKYTEMEAAVRARLVGKPLALGVLDAAAKGLRGNIAVARELRCTVPEILAAKRQVGEQAAIVKAERPSSREVA